MVNFGDKSIKFGRTYNIVVDLYEVQSKMPFKKSKKLDTVEIPFPLTLNFNVSRGMDKKINMATMQIYNLAERTRAFLYKDEFDTKYMEIKLYAGYSAQMDSSATNPPLIFRGTIKSCSSYKNNGGTEWITEIEAWDGGITYNLPVKNFGFQNCSVRECIERAIADLPDVKKGVISKDIDKLKDKRKIEFQGNPFDFIKNLAGNDKAVYVDDGLLYVLADNDCLAGMVSEISVDSGLLGSPRRKNTIINVEMIFEPTIIVGQQIKLISKTMPYLNNTYKIINFTHEGMISGAKCGEVKTSIDLFVGTSPFKLFQNGNSLWS